MRVGVINGSDVCRLDVPASSRPIWAKGKVGDVLYETQQLDPRGAAGVEAFIAERFSRLPG